MSAFSTIVTAGRYFRRIYSPGYQIVRFASNIALQNRFLESSLKIQLVLAETSTEEKLKVYGLYKQAVSGKNGSKKPSAVDMEASAKWKAWNANGEMSQDDAKQKYIEYVNGILKRCGKDTVEE